MRYGLFEIRYTNETAYFDYLVVVKGNIIDKVIEHNGTKESKQLISEIIGRHLINFEFTHIKQVTKEENPEYFL